MNQLIQLLEEAYNEIHEMWKVSDDSVADYILDLEVAMDFVKRALDTEDRLDIFKAIQKAHDVLECEEENELVDRLKAALNGLNENMYMKESELKSIVKLILKEISLHPKKEHPLVSLFSKLASTLQRELPETHNLKDGHAKAHQIIVSITASIKEMVQASVGDDMVRFKKSVESYAHVSESLMMFLSAWAVQITNECDGVFENVDKIMEEYKTHASELHAQFNQVFQSLRTKNDDNKSNYINAYKQLKHMNEIVIELKKTVDDLFEIGINCGFGKKGK
jgi:curved DNA-binding protein CbpA